MEKFLETLPYFSDVFHLRELKMLSLKSTFRRQLSSKVKWEKKKPSFHVYLVRCINGCCEFRFGAVNFMLRKMNFDFIPASISHRSSPRQLRNLRRFMIIMLFIRIWSEATFARNFPAIIVWLLFYESNFPSFCSCTANNVCQERDEKCLKKRNKCKFSEYLIMQMWKFGKERRNVVISERTEKLHLERNCRLRRKNSIFALRFE